jgi:DNA-binding CsgD family transcriptional regulator
MMLCMDDFMAGELDQAGQLSDEGLALCQSYGYGILAWTARWCQALIAAVRGDYATTRALADQMNQWAAPRQVRTVQRYSFHANGLAALGRGDYEEAYDQLTAITPAGSLASHIPLALWVSMDLVEAAVRTNRRTEAAAHVAALRRANIAAISPRCALIEAGSAAIAAPAAEAAALFDKALAVPGADRWQFDFARVQLAYGERLRRARAVTRARKHLTAALETFERLGARPWAARTQSELRAIGLGTQPTYGFGIASLTPREREIARLAAIGLTNKQIGERLYLNHRTVASHLYQIFPKLGITSRAALHAALGSEPARSPDQANCKLAWQPS